MKKYVLVVAVAAALFSCSGNPKADACLLSEAVETADLKTMATKPTCRNFLPLQA